MTPLKDTIAQIVNTFPQVAASRKRPLKAIATFVEGKLAAGKPADLVFICTHNSRRSHIGQIWADAAAGYYGITNVRSYSGGTEETAFNEQAVNALRTAGFDITVSDAGANPIYVVKHTFRDKAIVAYSKRYNDPANPNDRFAAIMMCDHADQNCPVVIGAEARVSLPFNDPKAFDGTTQVEEKYLESVHDIGREILYAFSLITKP